MRTEVIGNATLHLGDCRDILPSLAVSAIVTDPPYGTGWVRGGGAVGEFNAAHEKPSWDVFTTDWMDLAPHAVIAAFCAPSFLDKLCAAFATPCIARYVKTNVRPKGNPRELIVCSAPWTAKRWEVVAYNGDNEHHPTQKPLIVMEWCVRYLPMPDSPIVDPFMGSGTTGVACMNLGREFVGIEREPAYFDAACRRLEEAQRQQRLIA